MKPFGHRTRRCAGWLILSVLAIGTAGGCVAPPAPRKPPALMASPVRAVIANAPRTRTLSLPEVPSHASVRGLVLSGGSSRSPRFRTRLRWEEKGRVRHAVGEFVFDPRRKMAWWEEKKEGEPPAEASVPLEDGSEWLSRSGELWVREAGGRVRELKAYAPAPPLPPGIGYSALTAVSGRIYAFCSGPFPGNEGWIRLRAFDEYSGNFREEYAYPLDPDGAGVLGAVAVGVGRLLVLEGHRVYRVSARGASRLEASARLRGTEPGRGFPWRSLSRSGVRPVRKELVVELEGGEYHGGGLAQVSADVLAVARAGKGGPELLWLNLGKSRIAGSWTVKRELPRIPGGPPRAEARQRLRLPGEG